MSFTDYLDLLPHRQAAKLKLRTRNSLEINCEDLGDLGPQCPLSPVTPRTPKSLISQLSREDSTVSSRKRLSYSMSMERDSFTIESEAESNESDNDEAEDNASAKPKELNLLNIDITSLLGQRVRNHVQVETPVQVLSDSESFCKTPVKNSFLEKLRKKPPSYPVMYKPRRIANLSKQNHLYKFNAAERREFYEYVSTGLRKESREKLKKMKKLRIRLRKLTQKTLLHWIPKRVLIKQLKCKYSVDTKRVSDNKFVPVNSSYPQGPMLLVKNVDKILGLKKRSSTRVNEPLRNPLSVGNYVSEEMEAELSKQKLSIYRSLLCEVQEYKTGAISDLSDGGRFDEKPKHEEKTQRHLNKSEKSSAKKGSYVPIADRVFVTEKMEKPKGEMSVLRALLRKNKEDVLIPELPKMKVTSESVSDVKSVSLNQFSKTLKTDLLKALKLNKGTSGTNSASDSNLSSPTSVGSCDDVETSPAIVSHGGGSKTGVIDDTVSIISMSSDGESPVLNCCAGCNKKIDSDRDNMIPRNEDDSKNFLEPLTVDIGSEFDNVNKTDLKVDLTYGVPSPISSTSESPLPVTPVKKSQKSKDSVKSLIQEVDGQSKRRLTRSNINSSALLATVDDLNQVLKMSGESPRRENKMLKSDTERKGSFKVSVKTETDVVAKRLSSPKASPKKNDKETISKSNYVMPKLSPQKKTVVHKPKDGNSDRAKSSPKKSKKLTKSVDGTSENVKSPEKELKLGESSLKMMLKSPTLFEKALPVKPIKKSQSLTPSPSPRKLGFDLKRSVTVTPDSSPKKETKLDSAKDDLKKPAAKAGNVSPKKESLNPEKTVIQLRSSTLLTPTKMTIRTRSVSVDSNGKTDDNQYSLRSGNFVIDSPLKSICTSESTDKSSAKVSHSPIKDKRVFSETNNRSPKKHSSTTDVKRKMEFGTNASVPSPLSRRKRMLSSPAQEGKPAKLRKVSSDIIVKSK